jgi:hypothetical protein
MIVLHILLERMPERRFPKQDQPRQALLLDRAHPALRIGVEIRRPRRQRYSRDSGRIDELVKGGAVCPVPIMDEVLTSFYTRGGPVICGPFSINSAMSRERY